VASGQWSAKLCEGPDLFRAFDLGIAVCENPRQQGLGTCGKIDVEFHFQFDFGESNASAFGWSSASALHNRRIF
jgi:hypothetical protein